MLRIGKKILWELMVFKPSVIQPLYVQCFHFVKTKAYKVMLQYSSYYIGFFGLWYELYCSFIYILGSKSLGSSLTSQIAAKVVRQHVAQNLCKLWCQTKNPLHYLFFICIWFMKFYIRFCYNLMLIYDTFSENKL